jgi:hypothetical protein
MVINERYIKVFKGISKYLTPKEVEEELKDFIQFEFAFKNDASLRNLEQFLKQLQD